MAAAGKRNHAKRILSLTLAGVLTVGTASTLIVGLVQSYRANHFIASAATLLSAKGSYDGKGEKTEKATVAYRRFAANLFQAMDDKEHNALVSNLSAYLALAILTQGANGETERQLSSLLGLYDEELWQFALYLYRRYSDNERFLDTVKVANSLWIRETEDFAVKQSFLQVNADYFGSDIYAGAFNRKTVSAVNDWVKRQTQSKIKNIIEEIAEETMLFLVNTVFVESEWWEPWEEYSSMTFTANGIEKRADGLFRTQPFYYDSGNALAFSYSLKNGLSFMGILPNGELEDYVFDGEEMETLLSSRISTHTEEKDGETYLYRYHVHCRLPKFSYSYETSLKEALSSLGAPILFEEEQADFSSITESMPLYVNEVKQKTFIDVNKKGVSAAGATVVGVCGATGGEDGILIEKNVNIFLDRPFLYMIYDESEGLPLFIGSVYEL